MSSPMAVREFYRVVACDIVTRQEWMKDDVESKISKAKQLDKAFWQHFGIKSPTSESNWNRTEMTISSQHTLTHITILGAVYIFGSTISRQTCCYLCCGHKLMTNKHVIRIPMKFLWCVLFFFFIVVWIYFTMAKVILVVLVLLTHSCQRHHNEKTKIKIFHQSKLIPWFSDFRCKFKHVSFWNWPTKTDDSVDSLFLFIFCPFVLIVHLLYFHWVSCCLRSIFVRVKSNVNINKRQ